jgi:hypothetical protein
MRNAALAGAAILAVSALSAEARQCYRRVVEPPRYSIVAERVLASPEREIAEYVPAVTRQVEETVIVRPERSVTRMSPAQYGFVAQTIEASPAHREWRTREEDGEVIGCWVNVPARFARIERRVLLSPAREIVETIPAVTATRLRAEIVEPAHFVTRVVPARYEARAREILTAPAHARWQPIDACER